MPTREEEVRAERAQELINDTTLVQAFDAIERAHLEAMLAHDDTDDAAIAQSRMGIKVARQVRQQLHKYVMTGEDVSVGQKAGQEQPSGEPASKNSRL